jgi:hypothetical protein
VIGIAHHNKSGSVDPLQLVMGSVAFSAVPRAVHSVIPDPADETGARRLFGTTKNNLGRSDLPTLSFTMTSWQYPADDGSTGVTGQVVWGQEQPTTIAVALERATHKSGPNATDRAAEWLRNWLANQPGCLANSADAKREGVRAGHSVSTLKRVMHDAEAYGLGWAELKDGNLRGSTVWFLEGHEPPLQPELTDGAQ